MGNGIYQKMLKCCNQNGESYKGDVDVDKKNLEKNNYNNLKNINSLNKDDIKNEHKIIKTKSQQSSRNSSLNKSKNGGGGNSPPYIDQYASTNNRTSQVCNVASYNKNRNNSIINNRIQNKNLYNNFDDYCLEPKTKLILTGELFFNNKIEIDKYGMKNGLRQKKDGIAIFGLKNDNNNDNSDTTFCDCLLNLQNIDDNNNGLIRTGRVFKINFDKKEKSYILYFFHNSLILYYKINNSVYFDIDKDYYLILGDIFLTINIKILDTNENQISIQTEIENEKPKKYIYGQNDMPIKIGRLNCNVNIPKPSISKVHSMINFSNGKFYYKDAKSTNGSSLLIREDDYLVIKGEMSFKLEDISFKIKEVPIDKEEKNDENNN